MNQFSVTIHYKDIIAQGENKGKIITPFRAKELLWDWHISLKETMTEQANQLLIDCVLPEA
jgi:hypothetical protein